MIPNNATDASVDLLVAGAGGGLVAALRAAQLGLRVLVVERNPRFRRANNTSMSTAMIPAAGTRWQAAAGIQDAPELFLDDIVAKTKGSADRPLARALAEVSPRLVTWLADDVGLPIELATDFAYPGHHQLRCHTIPHRKGAYLLDALVDAVGRHQQIDILTPARLLDVVLDDGRVAGAVVGYPDGSSEVVRSRAVLLATNGFGANRELVATHIPEMADATYHGSAESQGDALRIGRGLGADTAFLDAYQGHGALSVPHATLVGWATVMHGAILVNAAGRRFGDETSGYSEFGHQVLAQPGGTAVLVLDQRIHDACLVFDDFEQTVAAGAVRWADDAAALAGAFGLDPVALVETIEATRTCARTGTTDAFGRSFFEAPLGEPLAGVRVTGALFHTQGGLRVDPHARVLRPDRSPIPGLYASGGAAMGISGHGAAGYLAGNGLLPALGLAFLAAEDVATVGPSAPSSDATAGSGHPAAATRAGGEGTGRA
jgi:fumarate reductase flavoprotein subunit